MGDAVLGGRIMTEKQYKLNLDLVDNYYIACNDGRKWGMFDKLEKRQVKGIINELNELYEENELLKSDENTDPSILELKKENESLKFKLESTKELLQRVKDYFDDIGLIIDD